MPPPSLPDYPWYTAVNGDEVQQGDILNACRIFFPGPADLDDPNAHQSFDWAERDVIVLSQSCDMVKGREKLQDILLCSLWQRSDFTTGHLATLKGLEEVRRGNLPAFHMLAECSSPGFAREVSIVDFHHIWSLPIAYVRKHLSRSAHLRLMPPYREHLSQAFARYFMRVGLPVDIPSFY